jgi:hypothetical protein
MHGSAPRLRTDRDQFIARAARSAIFVDARESR